MKTINFSIVSYLTGEEYKQVREIQKKLGDITGSRKCLEDWLPHITTGDGIEVPEEALLQTEQAILDFTKNQKEITARIKGFNGIENWKGAVEGKITPYVIWLDVEVSDDLMNLFNNLRDAVTSKYETWLPRTVNYTPHVTVAFADLTEEGYRKGMDYLKSQSFETEFKINHVALVECYGEGNMTSVEYKKFYFEK